MEGMLSQDEINALLSGMDIGGLASDTSNDTTEETGRVESLTDIEKDAIGEVANISMGTSATTLYSLVNRKVNITTPVVELAEWSEVADLQVKPCVFIQIKYTTGLEGSNILVIKDSDVKVITDLMMGGDGTNIEGEISELHLSAISEAMNQMMGSAATSLSSMLDCMIDISPPEASYVTTFDDHKPDDIAKFLTGQFVKISFRMQIDDLVDSSIMQLYPIDFARNLVDTFMSHQMQPLEADSVVQKEEVVEPKVAQPYTPPQVMPQEIQTEPYAMNSMHMGMPQMEMTQMEIPQMGMPQMGMTQMGMPQMGMPQMGMPQMQNVNVQQASFQNFSQQPLTNMVNPENIGLIMDVPLEVKIGRAHV